MEEFAIDLRTSAVSVIERSPLSFRERVAAYAELTKPRITFLIVLTSAAGFALASTASIDYLALLRSLVGIALLWGMRANLRFLRFAADPEASRRQLIERYLKLRSLR